MKTASFIPIRDILIFPGIISPIFVGRKKSIATLERALINDNKLILFLQKDKAKETPMFPRDIHEIGVLTNILQTVKMPNGAVKVLIEAKSRVKLTKIVDNENFLAEYEELVPEIVDEQTGEALKRKVVSSFERYSKSTNRFSPELLLSIKEIDNVNKVLNMIASNINISPDKKHEILEIEGVVDRGYHIIKVLNQEIEILGLEKKINVKVKEQLNNVQKSYYLKEKLKAIKEELGETKKENDEIEEYLEKIVDEKYPEEVQEKLKKEVKKLSKLPPYSAEASVFRNYIDLILELPWTDKTDESLEIKEAEKILEEDHYGLEDVKERILEFLSVKKLNQKIKGSILCLVGPPGVGKTSLAKSVARSMNREFSRISLGGVRDEAEIRGHRRTYIGSMPGRIIKEVKKVGTKNPLFLLDEIDKMSMDFRGDPSSALLEVLDPEQNKEFIDHYVDMPFDLSDIFFIATANDLGTVPPPLRDRMEIIRINSYTEYEKLNIAKRFLIDASKTENGLKNYKVNFSDESVLNVINHYTREAGVRNLKREIDKIMRKAAKEIVEKRKSKINITVTNLKKYLGNIKFRPENMREKEDKLGIVNGMAWTAYGGTLLEVQAVKMTGKSNLILTGKLGEIMKESAKVADSFIKSKKSEFDFSKEDYENKSVHIHFPEGAVPKDGPSAGATIAIALVSIYSCKKVRQDVAMTGEITITGDILPVGGIKEKIIGAHRAGIREVIIPNDNESDIENIPKEVSKDMKINLVKNFNDLYKIVITD